MPLVTGCNPVSKHVGILVVSKLELVQLHSSLCRLHSSEGLEYSSLAKQACLQCLGMFLVNMFMIS